MKTKTLAIDSDGVVHVLLSDGTYCGKVWVLPRDAPDGPPTCLACLGLELKFDDLFARGERAAKQRGYVPVLPGRRRRF